ncbi:DMT family transporter [Sphingosinicella sp. BN140058]|uniref:DMT family transporter n=1 Tax=Sphingosinicella sp. BN140058 TaxID=1892855 RepID=UPI001011A9DD|nr:DMT family transporter [Sphingosinicella sp. BN140058]QAY77214.1 DMT family transporter [Sphingosinicella sp. BN140058]
MHDATRLQAARAARFAFPALLVSNLMLAFGPWMVRLADVGPVAAGFWRLALAAPFLLILARPGLRGTAAPSLGLIAVIAVSGLFFAADLAAWHVGIHMTKLANATLFGNCSSFLLMLYGFVVLRKLPQRIQWVALALAGAGAALLLGSSYEMSPKNLRGDLFALLAGFFYALYLVVIDRARRTVAPMPVLAIATIAGAIPLLLFAALLGEAILPEAWTPLILLSLGSQLIGQGLLVYAVGHLSPVVVGLTLLTQPAATAVIGWFAYGERLGAADAIGAVLIAAALVLIRLPEPEEG